MLVLCTVYIFIPYRIDIEKELEKVDEGDGKKNERTFVGNKEVTNIPDAIDATGIVVVTDSSHNNVCQIIEK